VSALSTHSSTKRELLLRFDTLRDQPHGTVDSELWIAKLELDEYNALLSSHIADDMRWSLEVRKHHHRMLAAIRGTLASARAEPDRGRSTKARTDHQKQLAVIRTEFVVARAEAQERLRGQIDAYSKSWGKS